MKVSAILLNAIEICWDGWAFVLVILVIAEAESERNIILLMTMLLLLAYSVAFRIPASRGMDSASYVCDFRPRW